MVQGKILVIDDDEGMTELLSMLLSPESSQIITANSGKKGIKLAKEQTPDIIILDLMMPEMNGWSVCQQIRKFSDAPILILSAMDAPQMVTDALDAGADDYLVKPVSSSTLLAKVNQLTRRAKANHTSDPLNP
mgnify:CR=1 FL=1